MDKQKQQTAASIIQTSKRLQSYLAKGRLLTQLDAVFKKHLDESELKQHCWVANYRNNILVVHADNPIWLTRLRYSTPDLLEKLRQEKSLGLAALVNIECKVQI